MGCCLGRDNSQSDNSNNIQNGDRLDGDREQLHRRSPLARRDGQLTRRLSRRYSSDEQLRGDMRLEERVTRPLVQHTWTSAQPMTRAELLRRREEYYETRVTGRPEIWQELRLAIDTMETDLATAREIINASGIIIPTGNLVNGAYDEFGTRYELPDYCVAEPGNLIKDELGGVDPDDVDTMDDLEEVERRREEKGKKAIYSDEQYTVTARLSDRGGPEADILVKFTSTDTVKNIIRRIMEKGKLKPTEYKIRIAYLGKILRENESLKDQGWKPGHVINALVLGHD